MELHGAGHKKKSFLKKTFSFIPKKQKFSFTVEEIDIILRFSKRNIQFFSGTSLEYQFEHQYEINRIDRLQIGGDLDYIEEVALRYKKSF